MRRTIQLTLIAVAVVALILVGVLNYFQATRPNLLRNSSFDSAIDTKENWHRIAHLDDSALTVESDGSRNYAVIDTTRVLNESRNPYSDLVFAQKYTVNSGSSKTMTLSGSICKETTSGMAVVMLKLADRNSKFVRNVYRYEGEPGQWMDFEISASAEGNLDMVEVILGVNGAGRVRFDDFDLVNGDKRGMEMSTALFYGVIILVSLAGALALLEILPRRTFTG